jgi:hypothetical protein
MHILRLVGDSKPIACGTPEYLEQERRHYANHYRIDLEDLEIKPVSLVAFEKTRETVKAENALEAVYHGTN